MEPNEKERKKRQAKREQVVKVELTRHECWLISAYVEKLGKAATRNEKVLRAKVAGQAA